VIDKNNIFIYQFMIINFLYFNDYMLRAFVTIISPSHRNWR